MTCGDQLPGFGVAVITQFLVDSFQNAQNKKKEAENPSFQLPFERMTRFEPATSTLARLRSTS